MAQVAAFHCLQELVYHTNDQCPQVSSVVGANQRDGTGGKVECLCCHQLNKTYDKKGTIQGLLKRVKTWHKRLT